MTRPPLAAAVAAAVLLPAPAYGCEPLVALMTLASGGAYLTAVSFGLAVAIKCIAFAFLERRLAWPRAIAYMLVANLLTTLIGAALIVPLSMPVVILVFAPLVGAMSHRPAQRLVGPDGPPLLRGRSSVLIAVGFGVAAFLSVVGYILAASQLDSSTAGTYWSLKLLYVLCGVVVGFGLTTLWEEWAIHRLTRRYGPPTAPPSFFVPAFRANAITFIAVMGWLAIEMLPNRMGRPGFLATLLAAVGG